MKGRTRAQRERWVREGYGLPMVGPPTLIIRGMHLPTGGIGLRSLCRQGLLRSRQKRQRYDHCQRWPNITRIAPHYDKQDGLRWSDVSHKNLMPLPDRQFCHIGLQISK